MKLITLLAALMTSALLTVPTVTNVGAANAAELPAALTAAQAEAADALA